MELDHIFIFSEAPEQAAQLLQQFGLTEGTSNVHPGQGTACRRFFFNNAYLELVWVTSEQEIKKPVIAKTKLWERSQYKLTNYCPFGLCFRKQNQINNSAALFEDGWQYKPPYLPEDLYVNVASNTDFPKEPMLFEMPFYRIAPKDYPAEQQQSLNHKKGFQEITKVILTLPTTIDHLSGPMKKVTSKSIVTLLEGKNYSAALEFDHCIKGETQSFQSIIALTIHW
jgi:hypothetical protein